MSSTPDFPKTPTERIDTFLAEIDTILAPSINNTKRPFDVVAGELIAKVLLLDVLSEKTLQDICVDVKKSTGERNEQIAKLVDQVKFLLLLQRAREQMPKKEKSHYSLDAIKELIDAEAPLSEIEDRLKYIASNNEFSAGVMDTDTEWIIRDLQASLKLAQEQKNDEKSVRAKFYDAFDEVSRHYRNKGA